jgi:hypothetical protein
MLDQDLVSLQEEDSYNPSGCWYTRGKAKAVNFLQPTKPLDHEAQPWVLLPRTKIDKARKTHLLVV